jgi:hypothetical protein
LACILTELWVETEHFTGLFGVVTQLKVIQRVARVSILNAGNFVGEFIGILTQFVVTDLVGHKYVIGPCDAMIHFTLASNARMYPLLNINNP